MSSSTSTRVALSHKHENRNANGKIFFVHVQEGRTNNIIERENKKKENKRRFAACESQVLLRATKISFFHIASHKTSFSFMVYGLLLTHWRILLY